MSTSTLAPKLTADELLAMDSEGKCYELDDGELLEMTPPGTWHGEVEGELAYLLKRFLKQSPLGRLMAGDAGFQLREDRVRAPDLAFVSQERLLAVPNPKRGYYPGAPDLAVEVLSPEDRPGETLLKVSRFLSAGTRLIWIVDPEKEQVTVYHANGDLLILKAQDTLTGADVLPGFACRVADLFPAPLE